MLHDCNMDGAYLYINLYRSEMHKTIHSTIMIEEGPSHPLHDITPFDISEQSTCLLPVKGTHVM